MLGRLLPSEGAAWGMLNAWMTFSKGVAGSSGKAPLHSSTSFSLEHTEHCYTRKPAAGTQPCMPGLPEIRQGALKEVATDRVTDHAV